MKKKVIVFFILSFLLILSYYDKRELINNKDIIVDNKEEKDSNKKVNIIYNNNVVNMDLEEYVIGVVACEMPVSFNYEALKAMSVAARTFALYKTKTNKNYKLSTTTKDQCYITKKQMKKNWGKNYEKSYNKIKNAADTIFPHGICKYIILKLC